jgi:DnaJ-class molecular chaperone
MTLWITLKDVIEGGPRTIAVQMGDRVSHIQIDIPQGITDNDTIRYPGLAPEGMDLVINYRIRTETGWIREGQDLITEISVPVYDLILGGEIVVRDVRGRELLLTIPAGTQPGASLRMRGQGLPPSTIPGRSTNRVGDIIARIQARIPTAFSSEFLDALRRERGQ